MSHRFQLFLVVAFLFIHSLTCEANRIDSIPHNLTEEFCDSAEFVDEPFAGLSELPCCPLQGKVISPFGYRGRRRHTGTDVKCKSGDTICAAFRGKVTMASPYYGYGKLITLQHDKGIETYYSHLSKCLVEAGDTVCAGQPIGLGGRTGRATTDHLHFEIRFAKKARNSEKYFDFAKGCVKNDVFTPSLAKSSKPATGTKPEKLEADTIHASQGGKESIAGAGTPDFILIQKGDTLYSLARKFGTTVKDLQALNNMDTNLLRIGMKLKLR